MQFSRLAVPQGTSKILAAGVPRFHGPVMGEFADIFYTQLSIFLLSGLTFFSSPSQQYLEFMLTAPPRWFSQIFS
jgi:hypothetical protein